MSVQVALPQSTLTLVKIFFRKTMDNPPAQSKENTLPLQRPHLHPMGFNYGIWSSFIWREKEGGKGICWLALVVPLVPAVLSTSKLCIQNCGPCGAGKHHSNTLCIPFLFDEDEIEICDGKGQLHLLPRAMSLQHDGSKKPADLCELMVLMVAKNQWSGAFLSSS